MVSLIMCCQLRSTAVEKKVAVCHFSCSVVIAISVIAITLYNASIPGLANLKPSSCCGASLACCKRNGGVYCTYLCPPSQDRDVPGSYNRA